MRRWKSTGIVPRKLSNFFGSPAVRTRPIANCRAAVSIYLYGYAYLGGDQSKEAASEFQQLLGHRGIVLNSPIGALAYLGLERGRAASGDNAEAHTAYQDFFALLKDADPDIPILRQAKVEYAKLK